MADSSHLPSLADVRQRVMSAIAQLYQQDRELLERDANERSITHKLAEHLQREFPDWHVDCEYNRRGRIPKRIVSLFDDDRVGIEATEAQTVFPDIIVHRRGTNKNLIVIEVKKVAGRAATKDQKKSRLFAKISDMHISMASHSGSAMGRAMN